MVNMNVERNRLRTFETWPANAAVEKERIAKAGFFSTGLGLEVQCFCCGGKISEWNYGDQVMVRHRALDPQCPFVRNPMQSGNVPYIPGDSSGEGPSRQPEVPQDQQQPESSTVGNLGSWEEGSQYRSEAVRLESFRSWPIPYIVAPERLAKAGFYYLQQGDRVQCAFCSGIVMNWDAGDDPTKEHRRHFPSCPLHYNVPVGNIPLGERPADGSEQRFQDARGNNALMEIRPFSAPERNARGDTAAKQQDMNELGIQTHRGPRHPKYSTVESRLRTFGDWPPSVCQTPQQLAQAGFYHVGSSDQVRCFHCDGGLRNWDPDDDPWVEHARWFSLCGYVRLVKGDEFIQQAIAQHPPVQPPAEDRDAKPPAAVVARQETYHRVRDVTEDELQGLMGMTPAMAALQVGLDASRIKMALRRKVEQTGLPFMTSDALIEAVLGIQMNEGSIDSASSSSGSRGASPQNIAMSTDLDSEDEVDDHPPPPHSNSPLNTSRSMPVLVNQCCEVTTDRTAQDLADVNTKSMPHLPSGGDCAKVKDGVAAMSLEEEVRRLKEARLCKICMDEEVGVVFLPCGHLVTCVNCAPSLQDCPVCRQLIKATVRTFLS